MSRIMAHMVAYYPDRDRSLAVAEGLVDGGASYLEIQFPFSDPTADGPAIQEASQRALDAGFTVRGGFDLLREIAALIARRSGTDRGGTDAAGAAARKVPIFLMTYASLVYARGVDRFIADGVDAGAAGFILPDLPFDHDEGAAAAARVHGASVMPVTVTSAPQARLDALLSHHPEYVYVALRRGITGSRTDLDDATLGVLDRIRSTGTKVMAGFGVSDRVQVESLDPHVHAVVVGSALVRTVASVADASAPTIRTAVAERVGRLAGEPAG